MNPENDKDWFAVGDLEVGDILVTADGDEAEVTDLELEKLAEPITVYNLEVADFHTYFVGEFGVLVHNKYKNEQKTIKAAANEAGLPQKYLHDFGDYIEEVKRQFGKRNDANFTYRELVDLAKEFMEELW